MNTFQIQCFLAVANSLSFARAAEQMSVSQPAITHQIQTLENELNTKLFSRSTRLVELTLDGQAFISYAQKMIETEQQAKMRFGDPKGHSFELLSIGTGSHTLFSDMVPILAELANHHPNLHPKLFVATHERLFHMLDNDSVRVAFSFQDIIPKREHMVFAPLCKTSIVCLGKPGLYKEPEQSLSAEQLSQQAIIIHDPVFLSSEVLSLQMELIRNRNRSNIHFSDSVAGAITLARAGYGLALVPEIYAHNCDDLALYRLSGVPELTFGLFYNEQDRDDTLKAFVSLTQKAYAV